MLGVPSMEGLARFLVPFVRAMRDNSVLLYCKENAMRQPQPSDLSKESFEILKINLERVNSAIEGEYAENDRRLNWFLLFQAFLFQGYATALQAITGAQTITAEVHHAHTLLAILVAVGVLTTAVTLVATRAGIRATEWLKNERETVLEGNAANLGLMSVGFPVSGRLHHLGLLPTRWAPWVILAGWCFVWINGWSKGVFALLVGAV